MEGLRRKDTTKGPPLRVLSLDGGGVRGYSMLIILQEIMHRTFVESEGRAPKRNEVPKPCDHFDLIVGTGTGGLIALMLGRMRLSIETCKDVYVRMTKRVFETDKTIAGIPYRSTLFKASKLEEAIRDCVREHTVYADEGNDTLDVEGDDDLPMTPGSAFGRPNRSPSVASRYSQIGVKSVRGSVSGWGDPNALLYDTRENRTKTAVTAVYKGTRRGGAAILLRSYDSRKEPAPESRCTIWQAGRATSATALAFKPIRIGHSEFLDEGSGKYNPAPVALDEAVCNEWPGREIGVFVSIGTGKRPSGTNAQQHLWWEGFVGGGMGDFAEARRRLISKIEGCEETHQYMLSTHLAERNVLPSNYFRLNVDVGVGEFGMNEWNRLGDISTNTRLYLASPDVQAMTLGSAQRLARIQRQNARWNRLQSGSVPNRRHSWESPPLNPGFPVPPRVPGAIELPANDLPPQNLAHLRPNPLFTLQPPSRPTSTAPVPSRPASHANSYTPSDDDKFVVTADEPFVYDSPRHSGDLVPQGGAAGVGAQYQRPSPPGGSPRYSGEHPEGMVPGMPLAGPPGGPTGLPPPLPPKTPLNAPERGGRRPLPYPEADGPPPVVNLARKPEFIAR
ncbi:FabD/lysophospholipase-like protein [Trichodelitschia bisporula]|uniref:FabD/lysophospholipase-like protein n=1 Tax=Trichodelitschia bisporula TaxID=703511 RepID=A0A6G1I1R3_9PEZI|nr:FabD/lysophospholipase-like protein [Trichodelitschia bisporula]